LYIFLGIKITPLYFRER